MEDLHGFEKRVEKYLEKIKTLDIVEENKSLLLKFAFDCKCESLSSGRIYKLLYHLVKVSRLLNKDFRAATIDDLKKAVVAINTDPKGYTENTKKDFKIAIKKFYKWLNNGEAPETTKWIKTGLKRCTKRLPEEFPTQEEIRAMVIAAGNPRDKALVILLYESGCRIGELLTVKLKQIEFDQLGAKMIVNGKTGARRVRIILACDYLKTWIENHPRRNELDSYLWVSLSTNTRGQRLSYHSVCELLRTLASKAKMNKRVNPQSFRHARATYLANRLTDAQVKEFLGWTPDSEQFKTYLHLSGRNVDDALLNMYGLKETADTDSIICPRCKMPNTQISRYCNKCGLPFGLDVALNKEQEKGDLNDLMSKLVNDKAVQEAMWKALENLKLTKEEITHLLHGSSIRSDFKESLDH